MQNDDKDSYNTSKVYGEVNGYVTYNLLNVIRESVIEKLKESHYQEAINAEEKRFNNLSVEEKNEEIKNSYIYANDDAINWLCNN